ncbi:hypothetical protein HDV01_000411, partial [Terramyces sp. JEL0728]
IFKVFVENAERNAIYTYPYNDDISLSGHVRSTLVQPMGRNLIKAIVICLLSERDIIEKETATQNKKPRYMSGYVDGQPVYTEVRVYSADKVEEIEAEIVKKSV